MGCATRHVPDEAAVGSAGEALLEVSARGPEKVPFEKVGSREYAAPLRLAGTYIVHASLDGIIIAGEAQCKPQHDEITVVWASSAVCRLLWE